ncbi:hypothetical protein CCACVL1_02709 [Corchorus capsularis]|uniref:Uncharacterized protein n=1 Tax=Corchorus capsularis TaxID=210143 RepID=A0A1R3K6Q8_COCAP|nr:hypothetical protein CCACVL1_02709 [Corchorus capsularis]
MAVDVKECFITGSRRMLESLMNILSRIG